MRIIKIKQFSKWAEKSKVDDTSLIEAAQEIQVNIYEAPLGKREDESISLARISCAEIERFNAITVADNSSNIPVVLGRTYNSVISIIFCNAFLALSITQV